MSKNNTRETILVQALKMFNEQGVEYVGVREIAKELDLRAGNITYYFPTKDDLVTALVLELAELNGRILRAGEDLDMGGFLNMYAEIFSNQYRYRCLYISFVFLMEHNPGAEAIYLPNQEKRFRNIRKNLRNLMHNGYLEKELSEHTLEYLVSSISLMVRFWISESRVRFKGESKKQVFKFYLDLFATHFLPYATKEGKKEIRAFVAAL